MIKIAIVLNGYGNYIFDDKDYYFIIAVDGGYNFLKENNIIPNLIIGDLDSINDFDEDIEVIKLNPIKDDTDFKIAIKYVKQNFANYEIDVYNFKSISRIEHFYSNLLQLEHNMSYIDKDTVIKYLIPGSHKINNKFKFVSFFASPFAYNVTTSGFKYNVSEYNLLFNDSLMISNEVEKNEGFISFDRGNIMMFLSENDARNN